MSEKEKIFILTTILKSSRYNIFLKYGLSKFITICPLALAAIKK
jgi:hypothetical protein